jgi:hypothetical protein
MIAICLAVAILLIPIFLLFLTEMSRKASSVMVLLFVLAFAISMSLMGAKAESVFVGTCTWVTLFLFSYRPLSVIWLLEAWVAARFEFVR